MRIVAGKYRHRLINYPENNPDIRPTKDMVREGVFSAIGDLTDKKVLDLFAGSGSMGIEALSRGAKKCYFVDSSDLAVKCVKHNLLSLDISNAIVMKEDYQNALLHFTEKEEKFDLIILDPPYASGYYIGIIREIFLNNLLTDNGAIIVESLGDITYTDFAFIKSKRYHYGKTYVDILRRN